MKKLSIFIILILIIGAIFYFWLQNRTMYTPIDIKTYNWHTSFQFSEFEINNINFSNPQSLNLTDITKLISQQENWEYQFTDYGAMGILVTQIKDKINGEDQKYWQFFVADEQPQISADKFFPDNGANIIWKFAESEF